MKMARLTESVRYWTCAPIHSHAMGIGPQKHMATSTMTTRITAANVASTRRRRPPRAAGSSR